MALFRRRDTAAPPKTVLAAAMPLVGPDVSRINSGRRRETTEGWQNDGWYFFDSIGELRSPVTFIANACSQATPFAAEIDPVTQLVTGPTDDARVQRVAAMVLGGASFRAQLLQTISVCWQIPGESFIIIRPTPTARGVMPKADTWLVLSGQKVTARGNAWTYIDPMTMLTVELGPQDRMFRVWSPHPNDQSRADSAVRPAIPILREVEKSSMNIAAKLDSRLASNGVWLFPEEADFPPGRNADGTPMSKATSVASFLMEAMTASMSNPGTAGAQAPIVVTMPGEWIAPTKDGHLDLSTALDAQVVELRDSALKRLANTLDMPRDVAAGTQSESNHWGAWQVEESTYKIYIEPLLQRIGDAITEYWFRPVLAAMGVSDPERYVLDWDTSAIVKRPDATEDANWLYDQDLVSDDWRRDQSGIPEDAVPDASELDVRRLFELTKLDPTLLEVPEYAAMLGLPVRPTAPAPEPPAIAAPMPADNAPVDTQALPATQNDVPAGLTAAAELVVFDALSRAGGRLLTPQNRGRFPNVPKHELHTVIASADRSVNLLADSFLWTDGVAEAFRVDPVQFSSVLYAYVKDRIEKQLPHDRDVLWLKLERLR